jgi:RimJ/RimL family protein N-acetyltransferase
MYMCPKCDSILAILIGKEHVPPDEIFEHNWGPLLRFMKQRAAFESTDTVNDWPVVWLVTRPFDSIRQKRDQAMIGYLNFLARHEKHNCFRSLSWPSETDDNITLLAAGRAWLGYMLWSPAKSGEKPTIRQLFLRPKYRRHGIMSAVIADWVSRLPVCADGIRFSVESPNQASIGLLKKLGHVAEDGTGIRCNFAY